MGRPHPIGPEGSFPAPHPQAAHAEPLLSRRVLGIGGGLRVTDLSPDGLRLQGLPNHELGDETCAPSHFLGRCFGGGLLAFAHRHILPELRLAWPARERGASRIHFRQWPDARSTSNSAPQDAPRVAFAQGFDGVRLYHETAGAGEPLFLIAGQGSDHLAWDAVRSHFERHQFVILCDHRGTGRSDTPTHPPYSIRGFADDCIAILDHLGIERAHIYGHSMGGRIAQRLAIDHQARVGAVTLASTTPGNRHGFPRSAEVDLAMHSLHDPEARTDFILEQMFTPAFRKNHPDRFEAARRRYLAATLPPSLAQLHYRASEGHEAWDELPGITAPVLVTHGGADTLNPAANAQLLAGRIKGAELQVVEAGRHGHHIEFADEVNAVVTDFIARHPL